MDITKWGVIAQKFTKDNAPLILTAISVAGSALTAYQTARASFQAAEAIKDAEFKRKVHENYKAHEMSKQEKVSLVWRLYILPASTLTLTITATIYAHRISAKRLAGLAVAYSLTEKNFEEYKQKITEKLGVNKEQAARDELAQDRMDKNPPKDNQIIMIGAGDILCLDQFSGRYFKSDMETIRQAENEINRRIIHSMYASVSEFYDEIGLPATSFSEEVGWNVHNKLELKFSSVITPEGKPAIAFDFSTMPIRNFDYTNCLGDS